MINGTILKGIGGFYYVQTREHTVVECRARGKFRNEGIKPMVGDRVAVLMPGDETLGYIEEILPRKNALVRPAAANIDMLLIVASVSKPAADMLLIDKLLLYAAYCGIAAAIAFNKCDDNRHGRMEAMKKEYGGCGAGLFAVSAKTGAGLGALKHAMDGRITCLAGQSAAGKSSLINALCPALALETGGLSRKTDRGRHTTRAAELLRIEGMEGFVIDTPGFSMLEVFEAEPEQLAGFYPEFAGRACRFDMCVHKNEPECAVKAAVEAGEIARGRYDRYISILDNLTERKKKQYD